MVLPGGLIFFDILTCQLWIRSVFNQIFRTFYLNTLSLEGDMLEFTGTYNSRLGPWLLAKKKICPINYLPLNPPSLWSFPIFLIRSF